MLKLQQLHACFLCVIILFLSSLLLLPAAAQNKPGLVPPDKPGAALPQVGRYQMAVGVLGQNGGPYIARIDTTTGKIEVRRIGQLSLATPYEWEYVPE